MGRGGERVEGILCAFLCHVRDVKGKGYGLVENKKKKDQVYDLSLGSQTRYAVVMQCSPCSMYRGDI